MNKTFYNSQSIPRWNDYEIFYWGKKQKYSLLQIIGTLLLDKNRYINLKWRIEDMDLFRWVRRGNDNFFIFWGLYWYDLKWVYKGLIFKRIEESYKRFKIFQKNFGFNA